MQFEHSYVPIIRTKDAELRGYSELSEEAKAITLPVFELTRSRSTTRVPSGDIHRRMKQIEDIVATRPFILDLTTHPDLRNQQIDELLDAADGFHEWYEFLCQYEHLNVIPIVHAYEDEDLSQVVASAKKLQKRFGRVAFRADVTDEDTSRYVEAVYTGAGSSDVVVVMDCGYIGPGRLGDMADLAVQRVSEITETAVPGALVVAGSAFPKSVTEVGEDHYGEMPMDEVGLYRSVARRCDPRLVYGDYASIHPTNYSTRGGGWVPRVDVPLDETYVYTRYRQHNGGYVRAAEVMLEEDAYESIGSWGDIQIADAAVGTPNGLSPSFWIAVRVNIHVTRKSIISPIKV